MKYIKPFNEKLSDFWETISYKEYTNLSDTGTIKLDKNEIDMLLDFVSKDSKNRSLKIVLTTMINNVNFDFNRYMSLGLNDNIREPLLIETKSITKTNGISYKSFFIKKCRDDWFVVQLVGLFFKCDQIEGLLKLLNDIG